MKDAERKGQRWEPAADGVRFVSSPERLASVRWTDLLSPAFAEDEALTADPEEEIAPAFRISRMMS